MTTLLVGHTLLDRLPPTSREHHFHRLDDEEEDGSRDSNELNQIREKRSVVKDGLVDGGPNVRLRKSGLPMTAAMMGITRLLTSELRPQQTRGP